MIQEFRGNYRFLSNFYESPFQLYGYEWRTSEHCYQAQKAIHFEDFLMIKNAPTPGNAKYLGRHVECAHYFDLTKLITMKQIVSAKFLNRNLMIRLLDTGDEELIEGNWHHDSFWGYDFKRGFGLNHLGRILTDIRTELKYGETYNVR